MKQTLKKIGWFIGLYLSNIIMWIDCGSNVIFLFGFWNETISSHLGRAFPNSLFAKFVDKLFFWQKVQSHCQNAILHYIDPTNDLIPPKIAEKKVAQIIIFCLFIFVILKIIGVL